MNKSGFAWVTLATNDSYSLGALVLAHSLRRVNTQYDLVILITPGVTQLMKEKLLADFTLVKEVNVLDSKDEANLHLLQRPELGITFTKLHCWKLTEYKKCVFIDADALVIRNCDDIFVYEQLSAAPDVGWPDCFNSGVFVFEPSEETFDSLIKFAAIHGSFDGADQGLLNLYFSDWAHKDISKHLPFTYNTSSAATYSYFAALKQYGQSVRIIHFIGNNKPWLQKFDRLTGTIDGAANFSHLKPFLKIWWNIFYHDVHPKLADNMVTSRDNFCRKNETNQHSWERNCETQDHCDENKKLEFDYESFLQIYNNDKTRRIIGEKESVYDKPKIHNRSDYQNCNTNNDPCLENSNKQGICDSIKSHISTPNHLSSREEIRSRRQIHSLQAIDVPNILLTHLKYTDSYNVGVESDFKTSVREEKQLKYDGLAGSLSKLHFNDGRTDEQKEIEDHVRKQNWEQGQVDFMGRDSFDNILKKINSTLFSAPSKELLLSKEIRESTKNVTEKVQSIQDFQVAEKMLD